MATQSEPGSGPTNALEFQINIDLAGIAGRVGRIAKAAGYMVAIGHSAAEQLNTESLNSKSKGGMVFDFGHHDAPWTVEHAREQWLHWLLLNAFRDVAEVLAGTLEEIHGVLSVWRFRQSQDLTRPFTLRQWKEEVEGRNERFHVAGLPEKLDILAATYDFHLDNALVEVARSINAVRNCLVHRNGVVGPKDVRDQQALVLRWRAFDLVLTTADGSEKVVELGVPTQEDAMLAVRFVERTKQWATGESIALTAEELSTLCWTQWLFAQDAANKLEQYGRDRGIPFRPTAVDGVVPGPSTA